jgi:hypothetical protein
MHIICDERARAILLIKSHVAGAIFCTHNERSRVKYWSKWTLITLRMQMNPFCSAACTLGCGGWSWKTAIIVHIHACMDARARRALYELHNSPRFNPLIRFYLLQSGANHNFWNHLLRISPAADALGNYQSSAGASSFSQMMVRSYFCSNAEANAWEICWTWKYWRVCLGNLAQSLRREAKNIREITLAEHFSIICCDCNLKLYIMFPLRLL